MVQFIRDDIETIRLAIFGVYHLLCRYGFQRYLLVGGPINDDGSSLPALISCQSYRCWLQQFQQSGQAGDAFAILWPAFSHVSLHYRPPAIAAGSNDVLHLLGYKNALISCLQEPALLESQIEDPLIRLLDISGQLAGYGDQIVIDVGGNAAFLQE